MLCGAVYWWAFVRGVVKPAEVVAMELAPKAAAAEAA